jgi:NMT1-like family
LAFASESLSAYPISASIRRTRSPCCANAERSGWEDPFCHRRPIEGVSAYEITKAVLEHIDELAAALAAAKGITPANAVIGSSIPFHAGALRYYKEKAVTVPSIR